MLIFNESTHCSDASYELNSTVDVLVTYRTSFENTAKEISILTESCWSWNFLNSPTTSSTFALTEIESVNSIFRTSSRTDHLTDLVPGSLVIIRLTKHKISVNTCRRINHEKKLPFKWWWGWSVSSTTLTFTLLTILNEVINFNLPALSAHNQILKFFCFFQFR